jgi:hypothetical protein
MDEARVPAALLAAVKSDLRPVRPLARPGRRALALLPLGVVLLVGIPTFWVSRGSIGWRASWPSSGLSGLETAAGLMALAAGFREAIPGRELPRWIWSAVIGAVWSAFLIINAAAPQPAAQVPLETTLRWIRECVGSAALFSVPALIVVGWLVSRGLPNRPALTGAMCGLGVGIMADAGLRLFCWDGDLLHVLLAHGGAIAMLMALGAMSALLVERLKGASAGEL